MSNINSVVSANRSRVQARRTMNYRDLKQVLVHTIKLSGDSRFLHLFLLTSFEMTARFNTVGELRYEFISMENDSVLIKIPRHKSDQTGEQIFPKHIYANPYDASCCFLVALGLHYFSNMSPTDGRIFQDGILEEVSKGLRKLFYEISPILGAGLDSEHGLHSLRKMAATYGSGVPGGLNLVSSLRTNWSIGQIMDRYINPSEGNDQYLGRILAGLDYTSTQFGALPPHFPQSDDVTEHLVLHAPGYNNLPLGFKSVLPFVLASLAHHYSWLNDNLPLNHPIRHTSLWCSGLLPRLKPRVLLGFGRCLITGMTASGVPLPILNAIATDEVRSALNISSEAIIERVNEIPTAVT